MVTQRKWWHVWNTLRTNSQIKQPFNLFAFIFNIKYEISANRYFFVISKLGVKYFSRELFHRFILIMLLMYISIWLLNIWIFAFLAMWHSFCGSRLPRWWPNWQYKNKWCGCKIFYELLRSHSLKWLVIRRHVIRQACHNYDLILRVLFLLKCYFGTSPCSDTVEKEITISIISMPRLNMFPRLLIMTSFKKFSNKFHQFGWI